MPSPSARSLRRYLLFPHMNSGEWGPCLLVAEGKQLAESRGLSSLLFVLPASIFFFFAHRRGAGSSRVLPSLRLTLFSASTFDQARRAKTCRGKRHHSDAGGGKEEGIGNPFSPRRFLSNTLCAHRVEQQFNELFRAPNEVRAPDDSKLRKKKQKKTHK